jgi:hypothetical protein
MPYALKMYPLNGSVEHRVKLGKYDVMMPKQIGWREYLKQVERHPDLFSAISALRRLNAATK